MLRSTGCRKAQRWTAQPRPGCPAPVSTIRRSQSSGFAPESLYRGMKERYGDRQHHIVPLVKGTGAADSLSLEGGRPVHFVSEPLGDGRGLSAIDLTATISGEAGPRTLTVAVQDPLDPRLDLTWVELEVQVPGRLELQLDVPDQVLLENSQLWLTLRSDKDVQLETPRFGLHFVPKEQALPEALAWRKLLMKSFYSLLSEPRPWGAYGKRPREQFYASSRYAGQCPELFMTIDQCHALAPADDTVRQYREWVYLRNLDKLSDIAPPPEPPAGVPAWAWYPRLAWLEVRRIAQWWLDERLVPTGEFGGRVGDDTDLYQQFADLPFFEDTGVGARVLDGAARLAELADKENLRDGLNLQATDSLHAYEEGINHLALMARWFYGDPIYLERCMESARNMEALTIVTEDGRRHFRDRDRMGFEDLQKPRPPKIDGSASPLMWHTALQVADYNRNPRTLKVLQEWADTWLRFMQPGQWATDVEVLSGKVVDSQPDRPLYGGYSTQGVTFTWLYALTGQGRYVEPFLHYYRQRQAPLPANVLLGDVYCLGGLDTLDQATLQQLARDNPALALYVRSDPGPLLQATIGKSARLAAGDRHPLRRPALARHVHDLAPVHRPRLPEPAGTCLDQLPGRLLPAQQVQPDAGGQLAGIRHGLRRSGAAEPPGRCEGAGLQLRLETVDRQNATLGSRAWSVPSNGRPRCRWRLQGGQDRDRQIRRTRQSRLDSADNSSRGGHGRHARSTARARPDLRPCRPGHHAARSRASRRRPVRHRA